MEEFQSYEEAVKAAREKADNADLDVVIRKRKESCGKGKNVYSVSFASKYDSDYAREEIVHPLDPRYAERTFWNRRV